MSFINQFAQIVCVVVLIATGCANPFLYKSKEALSLVVTSSSAPQQPSNIADLRKAKIEQFSKQQDSEVGNDGFSDNTQITNESPPNEVIPGIVQKKIAKIFAKLQFLSSLSSNNNIDSNTPGQGSSSSNTEEPLVSSSTTTEESDEAISSKGNNSSKQFEELRNIQGAEVPARQSTFMPITLSGIFESIVNLAQRMLSSPNSKIVIANSP